MGLVSVLRYIDLSVGGFQGMSPFQLSLFVPLGCQAWLEELCR